MRELLIASGNKGKIAEIRHLLAGCPFTIIGLEDLGISREVEEVGRTFEGNSILKAMSYGKWSGKLVLSEDSGLEIDILQGWPGVDTKPITAPTHDNGHSLILGKMVDVPDDQRGAQFRSVITIYDPADDRVRVCEGIARGSITHEPIGTNGMAQDPIFRYEESGKSGGVMSLEEKSLISHRAKAFAQAKEILLQEFV
jgi:XTP/dITP diphosphohydrolase